MTPRPRPSPSRAPRAARDDESPSHRPFARKRDANVKRTAPARAIVKPASARKATRDGDVSRGLVARSREGARARRSNERKRIDVKRAIEDGEIEDVYDLTNAAAGDARRFREEAEALREAQSDAAEALAGARDAARRAPAPAEGEGGAGFTEASGTNDDAWATPEGEDAWGA